MPIFHDQELIHIHNPRCGGTTINRALAQCFHIPAHYFSTKSISYHYLYGNHKINNEKYELDHLTLPLIEDAVSSWILKVFRSFVIVRHPWDRFTSEYTRKISTGCCRFINHKNLSFEEYCLKFLRVCRNRFDAQSGFKGMTHFQSCHYLPQYFYTGLSRNKASLLSPEIINIAQINSRLPQIVSPIFSERLGEILNKSIRNGHRLSIPEEVKSSIKMISPELKAKVENFYSQDFELLDFGPTN
jgi:hypothetical protein